MGKGKSLDEFQDDQRANAGDGEAAAEDETDTREVICVFEGHDVVEQFITLVGATALELDEKLKQGDEVALEVTGKVQKGEIVTRQRERRDGGRDETVIVRKIKVDGVKLIRATSQML